MSEPLSGCEVGEFAISQTSQASATRSDPQAAFPVFMEGFDVVVRQPVLLRQNVAGPVVKPAQTTPGSNPQVAVAVAANRPNLVVRQAFAVCIVLTFPILETEQAFTSRRDPEGAVAVRIHLPDRALRQPTRADHIFKAIS